MVQLNWRNYKKNTAGSLEKQRLSVCLGAGRRIKLSEEEVQGHWGPGVSGCPSHPSSLAPASKGRMRDRRAGSLRQGDAAATPARDRGKLPEGPGTRRPLAHARLAFNTLSAPRC